MGAWIETTLELKAKGSLSVAPYVGAWIETRILGYEYDLAVSHLTWVRGLKQYTNELKERIANVAPYVGAWIETCPAQHRSSRGVSHLTWVRGLKPVPHKSLRHRPCRTLRGCVD